jgi:hypothetical protein
MRNAVQKLELFLKSQKSQPDADPPPAEKGKIPNVKRKALSPKTLFIQ